MRDDFANTVLMIRPVQFYSNPQTAVDNYFQHANKEGLNSQHAALEEFEAVYELLLENGVEVVAYEDDGNDPAPDSIFPNNWFSTHRSGKLCLYPMKAKNRRKERRPLIVSDLNRKYPKLIDYSEYEQKEIYLEGTGSLVLDRKNHIAYMALSLRSDSQLAQRWAKEFGYKLVAFENHDEADHEIYHTNVLAGIGSDWMVMCMQAVDPAEQEGLRRAIEASGKKLIDISIDQMKAFCGNVIQLRDGSGELLTVMSDRAYNAFTTEELEVFSKNSKILHPAIPVIEDLGGGGIRCMIAELF